MPLGLNKSSIYNVKNTTEFQSLEEIKDEISKQKEISSVKTSLSDYRLYKNFWNLQKYLVNPFSIFNVSGDELGF